MRGGPTRCDGVAVNPTVASSSTCAGNRSPQRCIRAAIDSSGMWTTNSPVASRLAAVSFCAPSSSRFTLIISRGGSSPTIPNMLNGAALTTPSRLVVVTRAIGRGTIRLAMSLYRWYSPRESKSISAMGRDPPAEQDVPQRVARVGVARRVVERRQAGGVGRVELDRHRLESDRRARERGLVAGDLREPSLGADRRLAE